jgi:UDP-N-acetylmuramoyl-tripeptide--D-alanyl-D-alanine ligase
MSGWLRNVMAGVKLIVGKAKYPDCLVLEIGADHPGDIKRVCKWLRPDIAVITRVSRTPVHVEFFRSPDEVFEEKASLAAAVKRGGSLILFADDEKVMSLADRVKDAGVSVVSFGSSETAAVRASDYMNVYESGKPAGISFGLNVDGAKESVMVRGIVGQTYIYPLLAAAAVGKVRGIDIASIARSLSGYEAPRGRMNIISGMNGSSIIDDVYNSSPDAASSALATLKGLDCSGSRIAILADMMELGKYAADEHKKIGREAAMSGLSFLFTVGPRSKMTAEEAVRNGMPAGSVRSFDNAEQAAEHVRSMIKPGDVVLIKGSQSMRMERATKALMSAPESSAKLLVRQEREWLEKA